MVAEGLIGVTSKHTPVSYTFVMEVSMAYLGCVNQTNLMAFDPIVR